MGVKCQIRRDKKGDVVTVLDPTGSPSKLYQELLELTNNKPRALDIWASVYTDSFSNFLYNTKQLGVEPSIKEVLSFLKSEYIKEVDFTSDERNEVYTSLSSIKEYSPWEVVSRLYNVFKSYGGQSESIKVEDLINTGIYSEEEAVTILSDPSVLAQVSTNIRKLYAEYLKGDNFIDKIEPMTNLAPPYKESLNFIGKFEQQNSDKILQDILVIAGESSSENDFIRRIQYYEDANVVLGFNTDKDYFEDLMEVYRNSSVAPLFVDKGAEMVSTEFQSTGIKTRLPSKQVKMFHTNKSVEELFLEYGLISLGAYTYLRIDKDTDLLQDIELTKRLIEQRGLIDVLQKEGEEGTDLNEVINQTIDEGIESVQNVYNNLSVDNTRRIALYSKLFGVPVKENKKFINLEVGKKQYIDLSEQQIDIAEYPDRFLDYAQGELDRGISLFGAFFEIEGVLMVDDFGVDNLSSKIDVILNPDFKSSLKLYGAMHPESNVGDLFDYPIIREETIDDIRYVLSRTPNVLEEFKGVREKTERGYKISNKEQFLNIEGVVYENKGLEYLPIGGEDIKFHLHMLSPNPGTTISEITTQKELKEIDNEIDSCK